VSAVTGSSRPARNALGGLTSCATGIGEPRDPSPAGLCVLAFFLGRPTGRFPLSRGRPEASARFARFAAAAAAFAALLAAASGSGGRPRFLGTGAAIWVARAGEAVAAADAGLLAVAVAAGAAGGAIGFLRGLPRLLGSGAGIAGSAAGLLTGLLATAETGVCDLRGRPRFWPAAVAVTTCAVGVPTGIATLILDLLPGGRPRGRLGVCSPAVWAVSSPGTDIVRGVGP
jgi:hypothetical protein